MFPFNTADTGEYHEERHLLATVGTHIMPRNNIEESKNGNGTAAAIALRPGHRIREIRQELDQRHHTLPRYRVTESHAASHSPFAKTPLMSVTCDLYQARLYSRSRSHSAKERLSAVREAIATSPYTWEDLAADGVKEWVEESIGDDVLLASALESLGDLTIEERPYLGKFTVERIYEILTNADAAYWRRIYSGRPRR